MNLKASIVLSLTAGLSPLIAIAAEPMSGGEFERYVNGKTLYFGLAGQAYGAEEYLPNRQVRWSFLDGECKQGHWYEDAGSICFVYEDKPEPQCWSFFKEGEKLRAVFENDPGSTVLYEAQQNEEPMMCLGPDVGV
ncbi:hypothetical protein ACN2XU_05995 [Primorskyibacter sp. 2E107]|uniref:hypothetical protein n=1 Tax=Primorskyibacter sp. 2E107 TaxID=3403458 RepID=UPI003AF9D674